MQAPKDNELIQEYLINGEYEIEGQFMWGSNYTFLCNLKFQDQVLKTVYKPVGGERPLWDFPSETLAGREVAAYLVSEAGGWHFVPPTVFRKTGPEGPGSLQFFIDHDPEYHYYSFSIEDKQKLRPVALFDAVINNTDRKGGHVMVDENNAIWLIDHGVCFHVEPKLRTVIWDFSGQAFTEEESQKLEFLQQNLRPDESLYQNLSIYLSEEEILAMVQRIEDLLVSREYPKPTQDRHSYPWPPV